MKEHRRSGETSAGAGAAPASATPGKRTLIESISFAPTTVGGQGGAPRVNGSDGPAATDGPSASAPTGGGDVENPLAPPGAVQNGPPRPRVTLAMPESMDAPLTFNAADYRELYAQVSARVGKGEAGHVVTQLSTDTKTNEGGDVVQVDFTSPLKTMLPEWPQKATQPQPDQAKFGAWRQSVSDHEAQHRAIYKTEYAKLKTQVVGPKESDVDTQATVVTDAAEKAQDAFDATNQPAPLAVPGGIEKVPRNAAESQPDATNGATNDATPREDADTATV